MGRGEARTRPPPHSPPSPYRPPLPPGRSVDPKTNLRCLGCLPLTPLGGAAPCYGSPPGVCRIRWFSFVLRSVAGLWAVVRDVRSFRGSAGRQPCGKGVRGREPPRTRRGEVLVPGEGEHKSILLVVAKGQVLDGFHKGLGRCEVSSSCRESYLYKKDLARRVPCTEA